MTSALVAIIAPPRPRTSVCTTVKSAITVHWEPHPSLNSHVRLVPTILIQIWRMTQLVYTVIQGNTAPVLAHLLSPVIVHRDGTVQEGQQPPHQQQSV